MVSTGYSSLDKELPGGGWPVGCLTELLQRQPGIGELRLLRPALAASSTRPIALLAPPYAPQVLALANWSIPPERLLWIEAQRTADVLWAAEQTLRAGTCGVLVLWQSHLRNDALRRLHLAAHTSETLFLSYDPRHALAMPPLPRYGWRLSRQPAALPSTS
ncbi:translesion DNA synthesis-associated protein ImuA [Cupriavidus sp. H39]|uniref:translesion DNA synthesis-associated protein ImuA n=1 Tax=Cupriavidus sp. H39 TaxID=3401635 RepID=UPI003D00ACC6